jgi:predicted PurR-regulated permease PerM
MVLVGAMVWLGATILGLPGAFALGILSGILELLPNLGPLLAIIPAIIVALTQGSSHFMVSNWVFTLIVIAFYIAVQQIENLLIVPKLMSRAVKLHPLVLILGMFVGALSYGILGAILAAPVIASLKEIIRYLYLKIRGLPVEVDIPVEPSTNVSSRFPRKSGSLKQEETVAKENILVEKDLPETAENESIQSEGE